MANPESTSSDAGTLSGEGAPEGISPAGDTPPRRRRVLAVVNPVSGPFPSKHIQRDLKDRADKLGLELDLVETRPDLDGEQAVKSSSGDYDCYLAWGGDGTVMEVATAAIENGVPLAIVPRGTANAVAWHFGLPFDLTRALQVAAWGIPVEIDVARSGGRNFLILAGLGWDAALIASATRSMKRRFGFLAYLFGALKNLGRRPYTFRVTLDDQEPFRTRGMVAGITNLGTLAGNIRPVQPVSPSDGLLDLIVVSQANFVDFFRILFRGMTGRLHEDPRVRHYQAKQIRLVVRPLAPLQIDGDEIKGLHRELQVDILPSALTVVIPPETMLKVPWMPDWPAALQLEKAAAQRAIDLRRKSRPGPAPAEDPPRTPR
jgi:diacylglycerol kinase family enzyme